MYEPENMTIKERKEPFKIWKPLKFTEERWYRNVMLADINILKTLYPKFRTDMSYKLLVWVLYNWNNEDTLYRFSHDYFI